MILTQSRKCDAGLGRMFQEIQDQVQFRAELLLAGRFEDMRHEYIFPLPVYLENRLVCLHTPSEGITQATALRDALQRRQVDRLTITVKALEVPRDGRFRVWADWHAASPLFHRSGRLSLIYYMRETRSGFRSEMLHYGARPSRNQPADVEQQQQRA